jgi:hypothetical protein
MRGVPESFDMTENKRGVCYDKTNQQCWSSKSQWASCTPAN